MLRPLVPVEICQIDLDKGISHTSANDHVSMELGHAFKRQRVLRRRLVHLQVFDRVYSSVAELPDLNDWLSQADGANDARLLNRAETEKLLLVCLHAGVHLVDVAEEDQVGRFNDANHSVRAHWNKVCHFELLRQMLDLIGQLARNRIDSEDHAVILHAFCCYVEVFVVLSASLGY